MAGRRQAGDEGRVPRPHQGGVDGHAAAEPAQEDGGHRRGVTSALRAGPVSQSRYEALQILVRVEQDRAFADIGLEHALERSALEPRDAALCTELVYGTIRWQRHLDWRLGPHLHRGMSK